MWLLTYNCTDSAVLDDIISTKLIGNINLQTRCCYPICVWSLDKSTEFHFLPQRKEVWDVSNIGLKVVITVAAEQ